MDARRLLVSCSLAIALTAGTTAASSAASPKVPGSIKVPIDRETCAQLVQVYEAEHGVTGLKDTDCSARIAITPGSNTVSVAGAGSSAVTPLTTTCGSFYEDFWLQIVGIDWMDQKTNFGLCWNGSTISQWWGPDCYGTGSVLLFSGTDQGGWCGVFNSSGSYVEPGQNFWVSAYITPWWKRWGYVRYHFNASGQLTSYWGSCCNG